MVLEAEADYGQSLLACCSRWRVCYCMVIYVCLVLKPADVWTD